MNLSLNPTNWFGLKKKSTGIETESQDTSLVKVNKQPYPWKHTESQKEVIIDYIAQGLTIQQIITECKEKHDMNVSGTLIHQFKRADKWQEKLKTLRKHYQTRMDDIDVTSKAVRLRRLDKIQDMAIKNKKLNVAVSANEQMRKEFEAEGDTTNIYVNHPVYNSLNVLSTEELLKRQKEATKKLLEKQEKA